MATKEPAGKQFSLIPVGALEQAIRLPPTQEILGLVDRRFDAALEKKDLRMVLALIEDLSQITQVAGLGLARTLYRLRESWNEFHHGEGEFEDEIFQMFGKDPLTVARYIGAWEVIQDAPEAQREPLKQRPIQDNIALWQYQNVHGKLTNEQLKAATQQPDTGSLRRYLGKLRGDEGEGRQLRWVLKRDGTLEAWSENNVTASGFIRRDAIDLSDPLRRRALFSLIAKLGVQVDGTIPKAEEAKDATRKSTGTKRSRKK